MENSISLKSERARNLLDRIPSMFTLYGTIIVTSFVVISLMSIGFVEIPFSHLYPIKISTDGTYGIIEIPNNEYQIIKEIKITDGQKKIQTNGHILYSYKTDRNYCIILSMDKARDKMAVTMYAVVENKKRFFECFL